MSAKDIILAVIAKIGTGGGQGYVIEYRGSAIEALSMEGRMTICNMSIEAGARAGMVAPDETTFEFLRGPAARPEGRRLGRRRRGVEPAAHRRRRRIRHRGAHRRGDAEPVRHLGHQPRPGLPLADSVPDPELIVDEGERQAAEKALTYMDLRRRAPPMRDVAVDTVFVGSCTNGRIEDLRAVADVLRGRHVADGVRMLVVPGSMRVRAQAESEGPGRDLHRRRRRMAAGRAARCASGMNPDQLAPGERCASTSNRNFEGRQGKGGRTHLVSPAVAAATAVRGTLSSPADLTRQPLGAQMMEAFHTHTGIGVPLRRSNVDTDQIIPAVYLKRVTRTGFEDGLFAAWRNDPSFVLNLAPFDQGSVLVAGPDFGTGSSREHAVWALMDYGFRVVISSRFADIFRGNAGKAGLLAAEVAQDDVELLWKLIEQNPGLEIDCRSSRSNCHRRNGCGAVQN